MPEGALTGPVTVTNPIGTAPSAASFKVLPKITGFAPSSVTAGSATVVMVDGFNLKVGVDDADGEGGDASSSCRA